MGFHDSLVPLVVFEHVKFRLKKKVQMKVSHSVVAVGTVCVCGGGGAGGGRARGPKAVKHDMNLISELNFLD